MAILTDGYFDFAQRDPGPPDKRYSDPCLSQGIVFHSAVGYYHGWRSRLFDLSRYPPGHPEAGRYTPYAAASVTGMILYDGTLMQNYPITVSCWGSGNRYANIRFNPIEVEGGYSPVDEAWRPAQLDTALRITRDISALKHWTPRHENDANDTLLRHHQCVRLWGGGPTACDSGRAPLALIVAQLHPAPPPPSPVEEDDMKVYGIRLPAGYFVYLSNGVTRHYVFNGTTLRERQRIGVLPKDVIALAGADAQTFMRIADGAPLL